MHGIKTKNEMDRRGIEMKKKSVFMFGLAAVVGSTLFTGSAFAREKENDNTAIYHPFNLPVHPLQNQAESPAVKTTYVSFEQQVFQLKHQAATIAQNQPTTGDNPVHTVNDK